MLCLEAAATEDSLHIDRVLGFGNDDRCHDSKSPLHWQLWYGDMHMQLLLMSAVLGCFAEQEVHPPLPDQFAELCRTAPSPVLRVEGDAALKRLLGDC